MSRSRLDRHSWSVSLGAVPGSLSIALCLVLGACTAPLPPGPSEVQHAAMVTSPLSGQPELADAVVRIEERTATTARRCTGVLIARDLVATASHCAQESSPAALKIFVVTGDARPALEFVARGAVVTGTDVSHGDEAVDWLVVRIAPVDAHPVTIAGVTQALTAGDSVAVLTDAHGALNDCLVRGEPFPAVIALDCSVEHGDSGSPVVLMTPQGPQLIGILIARNPFAAYAAAAWQFEDLVPPN